MKDSRNSSLQLSWEWTPPILQWELYYPRKRNLLVSSSHVPSSPVNSHLQNRIMTWEIVSCWCLFFDRYNFTITYRPGSRNIKPDALSRQFNSSENPPNTTIITPTCIVGNLTWETKVLQAQGEEPNHAPCPNGNLCVPSFLRFNVLTLVYVYLCMYICICIYAYWAARLRSG